MAQAKRKRRTKHRGNAAGAIETRGRTGRPPTAEERKAQAKEEARRKREDRFSQPPTWKSAAQRSGLAASVFLFVIVVFFDQKIGAAIALAAFMLLVYIPLGYFTDMLLYRRRMNRLGQGGG